MCNIGDHCKNCHDWSDEKWHSVGEYLAELSVQHDRKKRRQAKASSSSSFSGFSPFMPVPLCHITSPFDASVVTTTPLSSVCAGTFAASPIISAAPFVPLE